MRRVLGGALSTLLGEGCSGGICSGGGSWGCSCFVCSAWEQSSRPHSADVGLEEGGHHNPAPLCAPETEPEGAGRNSGAGPMCV